MTSLVPAVIELIKQITHKLNLTSSVTAEAILSYHKLYGESGNWNRPVGVTAATAVLIACRMTGTPRTVKEVAKASKVESKAILTLLKEIQKRGLVRTRPPEATALIEHLCQKLELSHEVAEEAKRMALSSGVVNASPVSLAGACTYLASRRSGELRSQSAIAETIGTTEVTIRNVARLLQ